MSNAKAQTLSQRFGFQDTDLKTKEHDEIMLWLDKSIDEVLPKLYPGLEPMDISKVWEMPANKGNYLIGFVDMAVFYLYHLKTANERYPTVVCFEVKSKIESLGELFRQLKMYDGLRLGNTTRFVGDICVVSPDRRFEKEIIAQGYKFFWCLQSMIESGDYGRLGRA